MRTCFGQGGYSDADVRTFGAKNFGFFVISFMDIPLLKQKFSK